jgi:hypothetical protein
MPVRLQVLSVRNTSADISSLILARCHIVRLQRSIPDKAKDLIQMRRRNSG